MEVKNYVKFTNVSKVFIKNLDVVMDDLQTNKLIILLIYKKNKVKTCISFIHDFVFLPFDEIAKS